MLRFLGDAMVAGRSQFFAHHAIDIGHDALISWGISIRDADGHTIFHGGDVVNQGETFVHIGQHVWIGQGVDILSGTEIGDGAIVGARSLVKGLVPAGSLVAGVPVRVLREGVEWRA